MMRRRGHGEGSIFQRKDGSWVAEIDLGWQNGHRTRRTLYARTFQEARAKLAAALKARRDGLPLADERRTVAAYLAEWLDAKRATVRPSSWLRYEQRVRLHVATRIGHLPLARLTPAQLQALYADRLAAGLSPMSVRQIHAMLHGALAQAEAWGFVARNVARLIRPPRAPHREMTALTPEQARTLLDAATGDRLEALYVVAVTTGMRQGELLALRWADVDLDGRVVQVRATLHRSAKGYTLSEPKTARSRRRVTLGEAAISALRRHRVAQAEERLRVGAAWEDMGFVFANSVGRPLDPSKVAKQFHELLARAGLPPVRFHDLRHTAASLLLGRGVHPKVVSEMLGHSQIAVTLDLYSHVTPTMQREAAAALDALLSGAAEARSPSP